MNQYWYVAIVRDTRLIPVVGPLPTREQTDAVAAKAKRVAYDIDAFTWVRPLGHDPDDRQHAPGRPERSARHLNPPIPYPFPFIYHAQISCDLR